MKTPINTNREKRKREKTGSPTTSNQKKLNTEQITENVKTSLNKTREVIKPNILSYVTRERSASMSEIPKNK